MTADPIAGIPYPLRSVADNITNTMQPGIDAIGALAKAGLPRGGVFGATGVGVPSGTLAPIPVTLARISGDTDMISGGNIVIPATWGGNWALTVDWPSDLVPTGARAFLDVKNNTTGKIYRLLKPAGEDKAAVGYTPLLAAGDALLCLIFCSAALWNNIISIEARRLS